MAGTLSLFLVSIGLFIIPPSQEFPNIRANDDDSQEFHDTRANSEDSHEFAGKRSNSEDSLEKDLEQLLKKFSAAERERELEIDKAENDNDLQIMYQSGRNIHENENRMETDVKIGDNGITRVDVEKNGQIVEQHYLDCDEGGEVIVINLGTANKSCFIHTMDNTEYAYNCEKKGEKAKRTYKVIQEINDKKFLEEALGISVCRDAPLYFLEGIGQDQGNVPKRALKLHRGSLSDNHAPAVSVRGCFTSCCLTGWLVSSCKETCVTCN